MMILKGRSCNGGRMLTSCIQIGLIIMYTKRRLMSYSITVQPAPFAKALSALSRCYAANFAHNEALIP